jgi:hypothetical protein
MGKAERLLPLVKANLMVEHDKDDGMLTGFIHAALGYAESYQMKSYGKAKLPPTTVQAVIMLATHFYESRDGSTGGFFSDSVHASAQVWTSVNNLLRLERDWGASI